MEAIDLKDFLDGVQGKPYKELVQYHLRKHDTHTLLKACTGTISLLPGQNQNLLFWEKFIDHINKFIPLNNLWMMDCVEAFRFIIAEYNAALYTEFKQGIYNYIESKDISLILAQAGYAINEILLALVFGKLINKLSPSDNEYFFNIYQIVTLNYAYNASAEPKIKKINRHQERIFSMKYLLCYFFIGFVIGCYRISKGIYGARGKSLTLFSWTHIWPVILIYEYR